MGSELGSGGGRCGLVAFLLGSVVVKALGGVCRGWAWCMCPIHSDAPLLGCMSRMSGALVFFVLWLCGRGLGK